MKTNSGSELIEVENRLGRTSLKVGFAVPTYNENANLQVLVERALAVFRAPACPKMVMSLIS
jgi:hypothetical protein